MPAKQNKACCCPNCTYRVELCCPCVCPAICVTFTPDDYADCDPQSVELYWDDDINGYEGSLAGHNLYYYIERDPPAYGQERGPCMFKLRSVSLGYPEGYEYKWEIPCDPYDEGSPCTTCLALETELSVPAEEYEECSGGLLTTECVRWVTPTNCDNCHCLCECLCAFVTKDGINYSGKLCWDDYTGNRWIGTVTGQDVYGNDVSLDMRVEVDRWGDVCDPEADYDCDLYDDSCAISATIDDDAGDITSAWQKMPEPCELRAVNYSWTIDRGTETTTDDITISVRCATCNEECSNLSSCLCDDVLLPATLTATFHTTSGRASGLEGCTITLRWREEAGGNFGNPGDCWESELTTCCDTNWVLRMCCQPTFFPAALEIVQGNGCWTSGGSFGFSMASDETSACSPFLARFGPFDIKCSDLACGCGDNFVVDPYCVDGEFWIDVTE